MASIEKRPTKNGIRYRVRITLKGHPRISETFKTRREAQRWAERTTEAMRQHRFEPGSEAEKRTVGDLIDRYIAEKLPKVTRPCEIRPHIKWWGEQLGRDTRLSQITPEMIARGRDKLATTPRPSGKVLAPGTVRRYLAALSSAFGAAAKDWHWLEINPCHRVRRPKQPRGRIRCLDEGERKRLLAACQASQQRRLYPLLVMALCTGARRGELLNLKWKDVDLDRGLAILHHTKNGERRSLAITGLAAEVMAEWSKVRQLRNPLVFASPTGKATFPALAWNAAREASGVEDFRWHDLRHTFASYLAMNGATLAELAEALGHKTFEMVKRYAHLTEGHTARVVASMTERFLAA